MSNETPRQAKNMIWISKGYAESGNRYVGVKADEETLAARGPVEPKHDITGKKKAKKPEQQEGTRELFHLFAESEGLTRNEVETRLKNRYDIAKENSPDWLKIFIFGEEVKPKNPKPNPGSKAINNYMRELFCQGLIEVKYDNIFEPDDKLDLKDTIFKEMIIN